MQIDIPNDDYQRLASHASAAGFTDVATYVIALAESAPLDPRGTLSADELAASALDLKASFADVEAGRVQDSAEAMREIAASYGLPFHR